VGQCSFGILLTNVVCVVDKDGDCDDGDGDDDDDDDDDADADAAAAAAAAAPVECGANKDNTVFTLHNDARVNLGS